MVKYDYGYIVIGGGSAGITGAGFAADLNIKTLLIEKENIGGDCTWSGCVPSKALIHAAEEAVKSKEKKDFAEVYKYVQSKIQDIYVLESPEVWEKKGVNILLGNAEIVDEHTIKVTTDKEVKTVTGKKICIATGAHPIRPKIEGLWDESLKERVWTYLEFWKQDKLPKSLAVIGAGPIGSEIAQACSKLGCKVTLVASKILPREAESARKILTEVFKEDGLDHLPSRAVSVTEGDDGLIEVTAKNGESVKVEAILVAVGRTQILPPGCDKLFEVGKGGGIKVSKTLKCILKGSKKTSNSVLAAGDCIEDNYQFTHYAGKQGYYAARNSLLVGSDSGLVPLEVPRATFTSPEIASVGFVSVEQAKAAGHKNAEMYVLHGDHIDRAVTDDAQGRTLYEIILTDSSSTSAKIIGANIVSPHAGEVLAPLCLAMKEKTSILKFADVIQPYPTYSFGLMQMLSVEATRRFVNSSTASVGKALNFS